MIDQRSQSTWMLVVEAAKRLGGRGLSPFKLSDLIAEVQRTDPARARESIQPVVQGMTINAGKGPPSPCGKVLVRVSRGQYQLRAGDTDLPSADAAPTGAPSARPRVQHEQRTDVRQRVDALIADFDRWVDVYDANVPFTRSGQYELHRQTIDRRLALGSAVAAANDDEFTELLYSTLQAWGIGRRASRLVPISEFRRSLAEIAPVLRDLELVSLEDATIDLASTATAIDALVTKTHVVDNQALIVDVGFGPTWAEAK